MTSFVVWRISSSCNHILAERLKGMASEKHSAKGYGSASSGSLLAMAFIILNFTTRVRAKSFHRRLRWCLFAPEEKTKIGPHRILLSEKVLAFQPSSRRYQPSSCSLFQDSVQTFYQYRRLTICNFALQSISMVPESTWQSSIWIESFLF